MLRTSHTGGHRFAATAVVLPEGTAWAWLDDDLLRAVLDRSGPVDAVLDRYRGSTALAHPALQVAEREVLREVGWPWLDAARDGTATPAGEGIWAVALSSTAGAWTATVVSDGSMPQPVCGALPGPGGKADEQLRVAELHRM